MGNYPCSLISGRHFLELDMKEILSHVHLYTYIHLLQYIYIGV